MLDHMDQIYSVEESAVKVQKQAVFEDLMSTTTQSTTTETTTRINVNNVFDLEAATEFN